MKLERTEDPRIVLFRNVLTEAQCWAIIAATETSGYDQAGCVVGETKRNLVNCKYRHCDELWLDQRPELALWLALMKPIYKEIEAAYRDRVASVVGPLVPEPVRAVRYPRHGYFRLHQDLRDPLPNQWRQLGVVVYLNKPRGGQLCFPAQGLTVGCETGSAAVFPISMRYLHEAFPPESGLKYILLNWLSALEDVMPDDAELVCAG